MEPATGSEKIVITDEAMAKAGLTADAAVTDQSAVDEDGFPPEATPATITKEAPADGAAPVVEKPAAAPEGDVLTAMNKLIEELATDREERKAEKPVPAPVAAEIPAEIKAGLEHEDPVVQGLAKRALEQHEEIQRTQRQMAADFESRLANKIESDIVDCTKAYGLTKEEVDQVTANLVADPVLASRLSFENGVNMTFPGRTRRTENGNGVKPTGERPVVRVVGQPADAATVIGPSSGGVAAPKPTVVPEGETLEQALDRGMKAVFKL